MPFRRFIPARRHLRTLHFCVALLGLIVAASSGDVFGKDTRRDEFFEGLRQRRLFSLVEGECLRQLADEQLSPDDEFSYTLELSRTFAEHARFTVGAEQSDLWERAGNVLRKWIATHPDSPQLVRVRLQEALVELSKGETLRWESDLRPENRQLRQDAIETLTAAVTRFRALRKTLEDATTQEKRAPDSNSLTPSELRALADNVDYRLAIALQDRAQLQEAEANRLADLMDAENLFRELAGGLESEEITWSSKLYLGANYRLRGHFERVSGILESLLEASIPKSATPQIVAEQVRLLLAMNQPTEAGQQLINYGKSGQILSGDLYFLKLQVLGSIWQIAMQNSQQSLADDLFVQATAETERAEREIGGYWGYRCRLSFEVFRQVREYGPELAPLIRLAETAYANHDFAASIEAYDRATAAAMKAGRSELAPGFAFTAASIELNAGDLKSAERRFREFGKTFPNDERAARAQLLLAYCLGQHYQAERSKENEAAYLNALSEHRRRFPDDPTFGDSTWMLARMEERKLQYSQALELYRDVPPEHFHQRDAQLGIARIYETILTRLREMKRDPQAWEKAAVQELGTIVSSFDGGTGVVEADIILRLARIELNLTVPDYASADQLLEWILRTSDSEAVRESGDNGFRQKWESIATTAYQLRIVSLAGQGRHDEARALLGHLAEQTSDRVLGVIEGLAGVADSTNTKMRRELGSLQLAAAESLNPRVEDLSEEQKQRLKRSLASAYVAVEDSRHALQLYEELLEANPKDAQLIKSLASLLLECGTTSCLERAKGYWQKLESASKPGSEDWMQARYQTALCLYELDQHEECRKLIGLTRLLYPQLGGKTMKVQFDQLDQKLKKGDGK